MIDRFVADPGAWSPASSCSGFFSDVFDAFTGGGDTEQNVTTTSTTKVDVDVEVNPEIGIDLQPRIELRPRIDVDPRIEFDPVIDLEPVGAAISEIEDTIAAAAERNAAIAEAGLEHSALQSRALVSLADAEATRAAAIGSGFDELDDRIFGTDIEPGLVDRAREFLIAAAIVGGIYIVSRRARA